MSKDRIRGRAGQAALKRRRAKHPFCAHCEERGYTRPAHEIDHITPLALGGTDTDDNVQGLCVPCHAVKTAMEGASAGGAANHPDWLRPASCRLTIVVGPPCAGKSSYVGEHAGPLDLVIDLDELAERISPGFITHRRWTPDLLNQSIRARNAMLGSLSRLPPNAAAWFIISAPTGAERLWWGEKLHPAAVMDLDTPKPECLRRAKVRDSLCRTGGNVASVHDWFDRKYQPWKPAKPPSRRVPSGADGYPVE